MNVHQEIGVRVMIQNVSEDIANVTQMIRSDSNVKERLREYCKGASGD